MSHPAKGEPALDALAFSISTEALRAALFTVGIRIDSKFLEAAARRTIRTYLKESRKHNTRGKARAHPSTLQLAALEIGENCTIEGVYNNNTLAQRMVTARKLMGNDQARWRILPNNSTGTTTATRLNDGERPNSADPKKNAKAVWLSKLKPKESAYMPTNVFPSQRLENNVRVQARKIMGNRYAQWQQRKTSLGVKITRVA